MRTPRSVLLVAAVAAMSACSLSDLSGLSGGDEAEAPAADGGDASDGQPAAPGDAGGRDAECAVRTHGPRRPQVVANVGAGVAWSSPDNARFPDGASASVLLQKTSSRELVLYDFGFEVPAGAQVLGVELATRRSATDIDEIVDKSVRLVRDKLATGESRASSAFWSTSMVEFTYGGPRDTFGQALTAEDVNAAGFGASLAIEHVGTTAETASVDAVSITVHTCE